MVCEKCGENIKEGLKFCPNCGAPAAQMQQASPETDPVFAAAGVTVGGAAPAFEASKYSAPQPQYQPEYKQTEPTQPQYGARQQPFAQQQYGDVEGTGAYAPYPTGKFVGLMLLQLIPIVGFAILIVFAFNNNNINRRNFCRAYLLIWLIGVVLSIVFTIVFGATIAALMASVEGEGLIGFESLYGI